MKLMPRGSFRKSKKNLAEEEPTEAEVTAEVSKSETKPAKVPRKGMLGKMGLKKKEKSVKLTPSSNVRASIQDNEPSPEEDTPTPSAEDEETSPPHTDDDAPPAADTHSSAEDAPGPMEETDEEAEPVKEEEEEEPMKEEDRDEEEPKEEEQQPVAMDPAPDHQLADEPVQDAPSVTDERDQPEDDQPVNPLAGYLCGCV